MLRAVTCSGRRRGNAGQESEDRPPGDSKIPGEGPHIKAAEGRKRKVFLKCRRGLSLPRRAKKKKKNKKKKKGEKKWEKIRNGKELIYPLLRCTRKICGPPSRRSSTSGLIDWKVASWRNELRLLHRKPNGLANQKNPYRIEKGVRRPS